MYSRVRGNVSGFAARLCGRNAQRYFHELTVSDIKRSGVAALRVSHGARPFARVVLRVDGLAGSRHVLGLSWGGVPALRQRSAGTAVRPHKTVVRQHVGREVTLERRIFHEEALASAHHYGFSMRLCQPYRAKKDSRLKTHPRRPSADESNAGSTTRARPRYAPGLSGPAGPVSSASLIISRASSCLSRSDHSRVSSSKMSCWKRREVASRSRP